MKASRTRCRFSDSPVSCYLTPPTFVLKAHVLPGRCMRFTCATLHLSGTLPRAISSSRRLARYLCRCSPGFWHELIAAAEGRKADEVLHHLFLYASERCLIEWHDAFANALLLDGDLPESTVAGLAKPFGVGYGR